MMRAVNGVLLIIMALFAVLQYNDPDGPLWAAIYGVPALWAGVAAFRPGLLVSRTARLLLGLTFLAALALVIIDWPTMPGWWRREVWWEEETAREGMGAMLAALSVLFVVLTAWSVQRQIAREEAV